MTHEFASLIRLWLTSGHGRPQKRQRRTWHFMRLVARLHGSLGCLLELWLSVASPVRPFLTGQQREESTKHKELGSWRSEESDPVMREACCGPHCSVRGVTRTHINHHPVKTGGQFYVLGFSCKCIVRLCLAQKLVSWMRWPMPDEHTLLWNGSSSFKWQTNAVFHCMGVR